MSKKTADFATLFKALADDNRLKIIIMVHSRSLRCPLGKEGQCKDQTCIKDLAKKLNIGLPTVSHHVKELTNAGLIIIKKLGRWSYLRINQKRIQELMNFVQELIK